MTHELITTAHREAMLANGRCSAAGADIDPHPVVKLFTPDAGATWLLTELDPDDPDIAFGLCDLGLGYAELGSVRLSEIESVRGKLGLPVERDLYFEADKPLSAYADEATKRGAISA
ncbi:MAG TPA: transposase [Hyphomonadaceae bacterium]|nr:transposase [Hyphomonadaceae bacterium]